LHKLKILHFLASNPDSTRYKLSEDLEIPHASTLKAVSELSYHGLVRVSKSGIAKTRLLKNSYKITSLGLIPIVQLYWTNPRYLPKDLVEIIGKIRKDFSQIIEKCKDLPLWGLFFRKWRPLFERAEYAPHMTLFPEAVMTYFRWIGLYQCMDNAIKPDAEELNKGPFLPFMTELIDRWSVLDTDHSDELQELFKIFLVDSDLKPIFVSRLEGYRAMLQEKSMKIQKLEESYRMQET